MQFRPRVILALALTLLAGGSAWAHHNMSALFDFNDRVTVAGTLTKLDWRNPHIYVFVDGKTKADQPQVQTWSIEGPSPVFFRQQSINRADVEAYIGKMVTAEVSRARDGSNSGLLRILTMPDGKVVSACPQNC
jgi:hypothetical protein